MTTYLLLHTPLSASSVADAAAEPPPGREGEGGRANRERSHRHYILSPPLLAVATALAALFLSLPPVQRTERPRPFRETIALTGRRILNSTLRMLMLVCSDSRAVRNYSGRGVQRQPQCRAFFRSDAPLAACCMPSSRPASEQAVDGFACPRGASK